MEIEVVQNAAEGFILLASKICPSDELRDAPPLPLRRTLSLMRLSGCKAVLHAKGFWSDSCSDELCGGHCSSCRDYKNILESQYGKKLIRKDCHKLLFFKESFSEANWVDQKDEHLIGFCIVQNDTIQDEMADSKFFRSYVTQSIVHPNSIADNPSYSGGFTLGTRRSSVRIKGKEFSVSGNYFSQQNNITNCCAHAAIKMSFRPYFPKVTAEAINARRHHIHETRSGNKGFTPEEIRNVIEQLTGLKTFPLKADELGSPLLFLNAVYSAIESRLPVILLFRMPYPLTKAEKDRRMELLDLDNFEGLQEGDTRLLARPLTRGHAVALIGHTFNGHTWLGYALKNYFFPANDSLKYLPSLHWCDNFVIQDDNFGPCYLLPTRFLTDFEGSRNIISALQSTLMTLPLSPDDLWLRKSMTAIIAYPEGKDFLKEGHKVEPYALTRLHYWLENLKDSDNDIDDDPFDFNQDDFKEYFYAYFQKQSLILRTFATTKEEYISSIEGEPGHCLRGYLDKLSGFLKDDFWISEISIPEVFWVNKKKVGEIIIDPLKFLEAKDDPEKAQKSIVFIRVPKLMAFFDDNLYTKIKISPTDHSPLQGLILSKGLLKIESHKS